MSSTAFIYPGQGSQFVGMAKSMVESNLDFFADHIEVINEICGEDFLELMFEGPIEDLSVTTNTQPALFIASALVTDLLKEKGANPKFVAGHSLGEYSALYAAEVFNFRTGLTLVKQRGDMMNKAVPAGVGTMAAIIGLAPEKIEEISKDAGIEVANYNNASQIIVSGEKEKVVASLVAFSEAGAKRAMELNVSGPFHSSLMKPMADEFSQFLSDMDFVDAKIPVVTNVDAMITTDANEIKKKLVKQLYSSVYWMQSVEKLTAKGVDSYIECGAGKVLTGITKRISKTSQFTAIDNSDDLIRYIEG